MRPGARLPVVLLSSALLAPSAVPAPSETPPFKLGTFERQGRTFVGLVRPDGAVVDVAAALAAREKSRPGGTRVEPPSSMRDLITRYDALAEPLRALAAEPASARAAYVHARETLKVRPPVPDPETMLNAAVNYTEHGNEMQGRSPTPSPQAEPLGSPPGLWARRPDDTRPTPYLFLKPRS